MKLVLDIGMFQTPADIGWSEKILKDALNMMVLANLAYIVKHKPKKLYEAGVRYKREARGHERWKHIGHVLKDGAGDCEDLSTWRVAELRASKEDPGAAPHIRKKLTRGGRLLYHVQVKRSDGRIEDPSKRLGM